MSEYNGTIDLIGGLRPKNNGTFPLVNAKDVWMSDGTRLSDKTFGGALSDTEKVCIFDLLKYANYGEYDPTDSLTALATLWGLDYTPDDSTCAHDYEVDIIVSPASCKDPGYTRYICKHCGESYIGDYTYPEHNMVDGVCTVCGAVDESACQHEYEVQITPPTCTSMGYSIYTCKHCGKSYMADYVDAAHNIVDGVCTVCGAAEDTTGSESGSTSTTVSVSITKTAGVSVDNAATTVSTGGSYVANVSALDGYTLTSVTVKMSGVDVTADVYADGVINISNVTGPIAITVMATAIETDNTTSVLGEAVLGEMILGE